MSLKKSPVRVQEVFGDFMQEVQTTTKIDYNVPASSMRMTGLDIEVNSEVLPTTPEFRKQMYQNLGSGLGTYGAFLEEHNEIDLLNKNVNELKAKDSSNRIVRTLNGFARAEVSDKFLAIDNDRIFTRIYDQFAGVSDRFKFMKSHVGANSATVKFISVEKFLTLGNRNLFSGFMISNSEIGQGFCKFETFLFDDFCTNGMIFGKRTLAVLKFMHKGSQILQTGRVNLTLDTAKQSQINVELDNALRNSTSTMPNHNLKEKLEFSYIKKISGNFNASARELIKRYSIPMSEELLLFNMEKDENSVYGLQASVTRHAQTLGDYEDRLKLETIGGAILEDAPVLYPILETVANVA